MKKILTIIGTVGIMSSATAAEAPPTIDYGIYDQVNGTQYCSIEINQSDDHQILYGVSTDPLNRLCNDRGFSFEGRWQEKKMGFSAAYFFSPGKVCALIKYSDDLLLERCMGSSGTIDVYYGRRLP